MKRLFENVRKFSTSSNSNQNRRRLSLGSTNSMPQIRVLRGGYNIDLQKVDSSFTKLHKGVYLNNEDRVKKHLCAKSINAVDSYGRTPLHLAAVNGNLRIIRLLLAAKANMDVQDSDGKTALVKAAECGHNQVIPLFVEFGANVDLADREKGNTALHHCLANGNLDGALSIIRNALIIDYNKPNHRKETFLHLAAKIPDLYPVIEELIANGIDIEARDELGRSAADTATLHENGEAYRVITKYAQAKHAVVVEGEESGHSDSDTGSCCSLPSPASDQSPDRKETVSPEVSPSNMPANGVESESTVLPPRGPHQHYRFSGLLEEIILEESGEKTSGQWKELAEPIYSHCESGNEAVTDSRVTPVASSGKSDSADLSDPLSELDALLHKDLNTNFDLQVSAKVDSCKADWLGLVEQTESDSAAPSVCPDTPTLTQAKSALCDTRPKSNKLVIDEPSQPVRLVASLDPPTSAPSDSPHASSGQSELAHRMSYAQALASPRKANSGLPANRQSSESSGSGSQRSPPTATTTTAQGGRAKRQRERKANRKRANGLPPARPTLADQSTQAGDCQSASLLLAVQRLLEQHQSGWSPPTPPRDQVGVLQCLSSLLHHCQQSHIELELKEKETHLLRDSLDKAHSEIHSRLLHCRQLETQLAQRGHQPEGPDHTPCLPPHPGDLDLERAVWIDFMQQHYRLKVAHYERAISEQLNENFELRKESHLLRQQLATYCGSFGGRATDGALVVKGNHPGTGRQLAGLVECLEARLDSLEETSHHATSDPAVLRSKFVERFRHEMGRVRKVMAQLRSLQWRPEPASACQNGESLSGHTRRHSEYVAESKSAGKGQRKLGPRKSFSLQDLSQLGLEESGQSVVPPSPPNANLHLDHASSFSYKSKYFQHKINELRKQLGYK